MFLVGLHDAILVLHKIKQMFLKTDATKAEVTTRKELDAAGFRSWGGVHPAQTMNTYLGLITSI